jgi:hypothetical protein
MLCSAWLLGGSLLTMVLIGASCMQRIRSRVFAAAGYQAAVLTIPAAGAA